MTQQVQVVRLGEGRVEVSAGVARTLFGERERCYWAINNQDLAVKSGSWVEVGLSSGRTLIEVSLLLLLPILLVFLLYALTANWFGATAAQSGRVLVSMMGFPLGFLLYKSIGRLLPPVQPQLLQLMDEEPKMAQGCGNGCVCRTNNISAARIDKEANEDCTKK